MLMVVIREKWNIIIGEIEKKKGKKSQALPTEKKRGKINQIIQTMNQQGKKNNYYYYYSESWLRRELILLSFESLPCQTVKIFIIKFPQFER